MIRNLSSVSDKHGSKLLSAKHKTLEYDHQFALSEPSDLYLFGDSKVGYYAKDHVSAINRKGRDDS